MATIFYCFPENKLTKLAKNFCSLYVCLRFVWWIGGLGPPWLRHWFCIDSPWASTIDLIGVTELNEKFETHTGLGYTPMGYLKISK